MDFERVLSLVEVERIVAVHAPACPRRPPRLTTAQLCAGLVYHHLQPGGTLAEHLEALTGQRLSDSAASQRRLKMPREVFETILEAALVPLAEAARHPHAFYAGLRLVGIDGTQFSLQNTPAILGSIPKTASRRLEAAFAKPTSPRAKAASGGSIWSNGSRFARRAARTPRSFSTACKTPLSGRERGSGG